MTDIKKTRDALGLSASQLADVLETDELSIRRMEMSPAAKNHRKPARRMARLLQAYLDGWRPPDWPE